MSDPQTLPPPRAMIGKWSVDRYLNLTRRWNLLGSVIIVVLIVTQQPAVLVYVTEGAVAVILGWTVARRQGGKTEGLTIGALSGVFLGAVASVTRFALQPELRWVLNIIIETALTGFLVALTTVSAMTVTNLVIIRRTTIEH